MGWVVAVDGYEVSLVDGALACRTSAGKALKSLPKQVRESEAVLHLRQVQEWLRRHETECQGTVELWLLRSLPVPTTVIAAVWSDPAWRSPLADLVVAPVDKSGTWRLDAGGFLRGVTDDGALRVVTLDGETIRLAVASVVLPHPVLLPDLDDLRCFAAELGVRQGVAQLFREIWRRPDDTATQRAELRQYAGGQFAQLRHLTGRASSLGYAVRGGYATLRVWERGSVVDARVWIGDGDPSSGAETGDLVFVDASGSAVEPGEVGAVTWSEGLRMAAGLHAARTVPAEAAV
jgi:hypothetical protein